jgi:hypothetical protein
MKFWAIVLVSFGLFGQDATQPPAKQPLGRVIGEVTAKEAATLTVKSDAGPSYTVHLDDKTAFVRIPPGEKDLKKGTKIAAADVNVGDRVMARGQVSEAEKTVPAVQVIVMSKSDLEEKQQRERAEWSRRGASGTVTELKPEAGEIVISSRVGGAPKPVTLVTSPKTQYRRYASDSIRFADAKPSTVTEIKPGDQLRVLGDKSADGSKVTADEIISGTFRTIPATVISVDAANGEIKVTDLDKKKPITIVATKDTQVKKLPEMAARMMAMQVNGGGMGGGAGQGQGQGGPGGAGMRPGAGGGATGGAPGVAGVPRADGTPRQGGGPGAGGPGGPGGGRGGMRGGDLSQMLEKLPAFNISELKPGDALIISSMGGDSAKISAITILAGVEPILTSAPRSAGQINLGGWSLEMNIPQ